jgi:hypothetical protein
MDYTGDNADVAASVLARLRVVAEEAGLSFMNILRPYVTELVPLAFD